MKPMNCPHHTQIFAHINRSYRELPQRYADTTMVYRDEQSGELTGLSRVLCITQDDAHVFCRESQVMEEAFKVWDIITAFYSAFGFELKIRLSRHDPAKFEKYIGTKDMWKKAEDQLRAMLWERKTEFDDGLGEAAFYGPKLDFMAQDSLGRKWQVATIQIDRNMPERFNLYCINEQNKEERIVMLHAAIMGSIERFVSVLIEHLAGKWPVWLNPEQVRVLTVSDKFADGARKLVDRFQSQGIRAELDDSQETINKKVRNAQLAQVNYILVFGEKELKGDLQVRTRDNKVFGSTAEKFILDLKKEIAQRR